VRMVFSFFSFDGCEKAAINAKSLRAACTIYLLRKQQQVMAPRRREERSSRCCPLRSDGLREEST
jgi:hypothetical protein